LDPMKLRLKTACRKESEESGYSVICDHDVSLAEELTYNAY